MIAALPPWAAALVWVAAIVGAILFFYRRFTGAGKPDPSPLDDPVDDLSTSPTGLVPDADPADRRPGPVPSAFFVDPTADRPGIPLAGTPNDTPSAPPSGPADAPKAAAPDLDLTAGAPSEPTASPRGGLFAPTGSRPADGEPAGADQRRLTVAEALRGITMPCGLSPVIDGSVSIPNPFRVAFLTTSADAATVGASVGDELEHLGYSLTTTTVTEVLARKPGVDLRVVLYPSPAKATRGLDPLFPAAPADSVGIEFST